MKTQMEILKAIAAIDDDLQELLDVTPHDAPGQLGRRIRQACECLYDAMHELTDFPAPKDEGLQDEIELWAESLKVKKGIDQWAKKDLRTQ